MDEDTFKEVFQYPVNVNTFAIPNDASLQLEHEVYKPSEHTKHLQSEQGRSVFPELFIENYNLGTLLDLCVRTLARSFGARPLPVIAKHSRLLQIHYDSLDIDMPLDKCYFINEERFWKRLVMAKHHDKSLVLQPNVEWKKLGVSLKLVEILESLPAEYWREEEMKDLALKIKDYVSDMYIKRLQSLQLSSFEKFFTSESESSTEDEESEEDESESSVSTSSEDIGEEEEDEDATLKTESQLELEREEARKKAQRKRVRQQLREAKQKEKEAREARRKKRAARRAKKHSIVEKVVKKIPKNPKDVYKIPIEESEESDDQIKDKRNPALFLANLRKYDYPSEDCHHIDLKFFQYFTNLETFTIEFWGPLQQRDYHIRHRNFSLQDIKNLAAGLGKLPKLKTFRLRNSRMDAEKLLVLCRALGELESLQTLDFGNDQLNEDCAPVFSELFEITISLKNLELESNNFCKEVLKALGKGLKSYKDNTLEYLGLARNPIDDQALDALVTTIIGTKHVSHLNITGLKCVTEVGICNSLANHLLREHEPLIKINICAISISPLAADEIVIALAKNYKILEFYCCGCELDAETEIDINVLMKRNKYISENYFVGRPSATSEEVEEWLSKVKNPILLKVLAERQKQAECMACLPTQFIPSPVTSATSLATSHESMDLIAKIYGEAQEEEREKSAKVTEKFVYPANDFTEKEFLQHVAQPGPRERYYYFKNYKEKYYVKDNIKNVSMI